MNTRKRIILPLVVILVVLLQLVTPGLALAQDETPPEVVPTEAPVDPGAGETPTIPEILAEAPADTQIVVVNEEGAIEPLATVDAAAIIATSDPVWCPGIETPATDNDPGTPGNQNGCTTNQANVTDLIAYLLDPDSDPLTPTPYTGAGTIFFQSGTYTAEPTITIDSTVLPALTDLGLEGGWDLINNVKDAVTPTTTFNVPLSVDWAANVTLTDFIFDLSGYAGTDPGLYVATGGGDIALDNVDVVNNPGGGGAVLDTAYIVDTDPDPAVTNLAVTGAGTVDVTDSEFSANDGAGLMIWSSDAVTLTDVVASTNGDTGLYVDNCLDFFGTGCAGTGAVTITGAGVADDFVDNDGLGIYVDSGGDILVEDVTASNNGWDGADLLNDEAQGTGNDVEIRNSNFDGNDDTGLLVYSDGNITIGDSIGNGISANNNNAGASLNTLGDVSIYFSNFSDNLLTDGLAVETEGNITLDHVAAIGNELKGAYLSTVGTSTISVFNSALNGNGSYGIYAHSMDGDITLESVDASYNGIKGAYLEAACTCTGDIFVTASVFTGNGSYGLYAITQQGNITLDMVEEDGDGDPDPLVVDPTTSIGAFLKSYGGGVITVTDSTFANNTGYGLEAVGTFGGPGPAIQLNYVTAEDNGSDGAHLMSGWVFGCFGPMNIEAAVTGGTYQNNAGYGIYAAPGPAGLLTLSGTITFLANTDGDTFVDLFDPCIPEPPKPPEPPAPPSNVIEVPDQGGTPVEVDCEDYSATVLVLPNGDEVRYACPGSGMFIIHHLGQDELPGQIAAGPRFIAAVDISVEQDGGPIIVEEEGGYFLVTFQVPAGMEDERFSILYWDPTAKDGEGDWVELPADQLTGEVIHLHPDTPEDNMLIVRGVRRDGNTVTVKVNFTGTFVLVAR